MKRIFLLFIGLIFTVSALQIHSQELRPNHRITGVTYAGTKVNRIYIPPPKEYMLKKDSKGGGNVTVFYTGFSADAKKAVEFAVTILETLLPPDANIKVNASWTQISTNGVLGNSRITGFAGGWGINALEPFAFYPVTIAEKIAGQRLNEDTEGDIELVLNSTANWYLGTDGNTPSQRYDLVTVVLHELFHGLGFFDSMAVNGSLGSYGIGTLPIVYDLFVENLNEKRLTDTLAFRQNTSALGREITGGQLYFNGPLVKTYLKGSRARLYAPSTWDEGSSVSHLDEARTLQADALMTPFIDLGEAIHDPGKLNLSILGDLGWINTRILHDKIKDTEERLSEIEITATISSDTLYNRNNVGLVYSLDNFITADTLYMTESTKDFFRQKIMIPSYNSRVDYYIFAEDDFLRLYRMPSVAERRPFSTFIGLDTVKPVIFHTPESYYFEKADSIEFNATVTDNLGVDTVYVEIKVNEGQSIFYGLMARRNDRFRHAISLKNNFVGGDKVQYRIVAVDKAASSNTRRSPSAGYHEINIESLGNVTRNYSTGFDDIGSDFFNSGFDIIQPQGFSGYALHSKHPYESPEKEEESLEFSSVLRHPIIFDASGMVIEFREIVLVEPGEEGSVYGFSDFYDYVVVEGSADYGRTWFSLVDGYDSRINASWEESYMSNLVGQNSVFAGDESLFSKRTLYPRVQDKISSGDTLLLRFRLFSDPFANGWGWAIDDLKINPLVDAVEDTYTGSVKLYPNPGSGLITIDMGETPYSKPLTYSIFNATGMGLINNGKLTGNKTTIDISRFPSGLYIIVINEGNRIQTLRYSLIR